MKEQYRLKIPEMIPKHLLAKALSLKSLDGKVVYKDKMLNGKTEVLFPLEVPGHYQNIYPPEDWLKEIPQKSAFQEWNKQAAKHDLDLGERAQQRKEGWNAGIDAVLELETNGIESDGTLSTAGFIITKEIRKLKESQSETALLRC